MEKKGHYPIGSGSAIRAPVEYAGIDDGWVIRMFWNWSTG